MVLGVGDAVASGVPPPVAVGLGPVTDVLVALGWLGVVAVATGVA